jgi:outer membrane protein insertion porin family
MRTVVCLAVLAISTTVASAQNRITEIEVRENSKTTDRTVIQISKIERGDTWSAELQKRAERELVSSGLFKHVQVANEPGMNGVRVVIVARDKHSWVIAPTFYDQPTNRGVGLGFGENNLFGENKKLLLYGQVATGDSFFIGAYVDPAIRGSRFMWVLDVYLKSARTYEYAPPTDFREVPEQVRTSRMQYLNAGIVGGVTLFDDLQLNARFRGAKVSFKNVGLAEGAELEDVTEDPDATEAPPPGPEGWDVSAIGAITLDTRSNWYGITKGTKLRLEYEHTLKSLGSDFDYWIFIASFAHAHVFFERHNLDIRGRAGFGKNLPFQAEFTSGGVSLRGYQNDQFRGDLKVASNVEYSVPVFTLWGFALRAMAFVDLTYTTFRDTPNDYRNHLPDPEQRGLAPFRTSVGLGTRVFLRQIVLPLLGLDFGYSPETGGYEMYFAIGLTDF